MNFIDRVFHPSKVSALENQVDVLEKELQNRNVEEAKKDDLISMLDDELRQVAIGRYMGKYVKVTHQDIFKIFKVEHVTVENGLVALQSLKSVWVKNDESEGGIIYGPTVNQANETFVCHETTLSHYRTIAEVVRASEFHKLVTKYE